MKILNKFSENNLRILFIILTLYCFVLSSFAFIHVMITNRMTTDDCLWVKKYQDKITQDGFFIIKIIPGGVADQAGIKEGDILLAINDVPLKDVNTAQAELNKYTENDNVVYTIARNNSIFKVNINVYKYFNLLFLIFILLGLGFLVIGFLVGYSKPKELTSQLFFLMGCCASMGLQSYAGLDYPFKGIFIFLIPNYILSFFLFHPLFVHFFLTYPIKYEFKPKKKKHLLFFIYSFIFIVLLIYSSVLFGNYWNLIGTVVYVTLSILVIYIIAGFGLFINSYLRIKNQTSKKSLKILLIGFIIGSIGFLYYLLSPFTNPGPNFLTHPLVFLPTILILAIPISFGYSIFKYRILDTEFIIKRSLVFGIMTAAIVGLYLLIVFLVEYLLSGYIKNRQIIMIAFAIIVTFTFDFVNKKAKEFVDKQFYRERYNYRKSLLEFSQELSYLRDIKEVLNRIAYSVKETIGIKKVGVWIKDNSYSSLFNEYKILEKDSSKAKDNIYTNIFSKSKSPKLFYEVNLNELNLTEEEKNILRNEDVLVSIPLYLKNRLIGALNFGSKDSGKAYSEEDIDLLETLASQSAIAFENARLQKEELKKLKIQEELSIARNIQFGLLPRANVNVNGLEISGISKPAKEIGGDFYDFIEIDKNKVLIVVADVAGKGIPAALYMSKIQAMIQFASKLFSSPKDILIEVNKQIYKKLEKKSFVTMVIALFDTQNMKVKICRAGHNPVIYSQNGSVGFLKNKGIGLGLDEETLFNQNLEETELPLKKDNVFVFYSDGLTESMNIEKEEFGSNKILNLIELNKQKNSKEIQTILLDSINKHQGQAEQNDDITIVTVKVV